MKTINQKLGDLSTLNSNYCKSSVREHVLGQINYVGLVRDLGLMMLCVGVYRGYWKLEGLGLSMKKIAGYGV